MKKKKPEQLLKTAVKAMYQRPRKDAEQSLLKL